MALVVESSVLKQKKIELPKISTAETFLQASFAKLLVISASLYCIPSFYAKGSIVLDFKN